MARIKTVLLDMDGILVDFLTAALDYFDCDISDCKPGQWSIIDTIGLTTHEVFGVMDVEYWANIPKTPWFNALLSSVELSFPEAEVHICSAPPHFHEVTEKNIADCVLGKLKWLNREMPDITARDAYCLSSNKQLMANPSALLVDDANHNVGDFTAAGGHAVLVPSIGNSMHELLPIFRDDPAQWFMEAFSPYKG